jgi:hypothetical protein
MSGYFYSVEQKISAGFVCAKQRLHPARYLIAGPYAGEFGWELMQWQGYVRARRPHYEQVHVISYPGRDYLYEGCSVHYHDIPLQAAGHRYGTLSPRQSRAMAEAKAQELGLRNYDVFSPHLLCTQYHKRLFVKQEFRLFTEPPLGGTTRDIAFHFRSVQKAADHPKNYSPELAEELVLRCLKSGLKVLCVGHPNFSTCPRGAEDARSIDLRQTVAAISSVHLVAGENSGPMHLSNLCGKPTVLWAYHQSSIDYSLRWNPFRVPIYVAAKDTHQPAPQSVHAAIIEAMADLRERTHGFSKPCYTLPAQPIAYY